MTAHSLGRNQLAHGTELIDHHVRELFRIYAHLTTPKALKIGKRGMGPTANSVPLCEAQCLSDHGRVPAVETARHVGGVNVRHHALIVPDPEQPVGFPQVAVDPKRQHLSFSFRAAASRAIPAVLGALANRSRRRRATRARSRSFGTTTRHS